MILSEIFGPVLQGEGVTLGVPAIFLRVTGCNFQCGFGQNTSGASWVCDSKEIWKRGKEYTNEQILEFIKNSGELERVLAGNTHIILTGGEPTIPKNQKDIISFIEFMDNVYPHNLIYYEIETNGSSSVMADFFSTYIDQVNCSPKLSNSGIPLEERIIPWALSNVNAHNNSWFKFVITTPADWDEIVRDFLPHIDRKKILLMPAGMDIEELEVTSKVVWEIAARENLRMTTRLQIYVWRKKTGV